MKMKYPKIKKNSNNGKRSVSLPHIIFTFAVLVKWILVSIERTDEWCD